MSQLTELLMWLSEILIALALLLALLRLFRGPRGADRLLAAETVALGLVGLLLLQASVGDARLYIDAALGLALFSFVGAVVFARLSERGELDD